MGHVKSPSTARIEEMFPRVGARQMLRPSNKTAMDRALACPGKSLEEKSASRFWANFER
jgi:hypothetical protein